MALLALRDGPSRSHCSRGGGAVLLPPPDEDYHFLLVMNRIEFWKLGTG